VNNTTPEYRVAHPYNLQPLRPLARSSARPFANTRSKFGSWATVSGRQ
jgi:hypothetical protein